MKIAWMSACFLVSWNSAEKAMGEQAQTLFSPDHVWLWWLPAVIWFVFAILTVFVRTEPA